MVIHMKIELITLALCAVLATVVMAISPHRLTCSRGDTVVYDSGYVGPIQSVRKGNRNDHWNIGWWKTYQPETGVQCEASFK